MFSVTHQSPDNKNNKVISIISNNRADIQVTVALPFKNTYPINMKLLPIFSIICIPQIVAFSCVRESFVASRPSLNSKGSLQASSANASGEDHGGRKQFSMFLFLLVRISFFSILTSIHLMFLQLFIF